MKIPEKWKYCGEDRGGCSCMTIWNIESDCPVATIESGDWGDSYPAIRIKMPGAINEVAEPYMEKIVYGNIPKEVAEFNIRLITKSPETLKALIELVRDVEDMGLPNESLAHARKIINEIMEGQNDGRKLSECR